MTLTIRDGALYEGPKKLTDEFYNSRQAVSTAEHRAHALAHIAFHHGEEAVNECVSGFDRTGLPADAWWRQREHAGCEDVEVALTKYLKSFLPLLSKGEWRTFTAHKEPDAFSAFSTLWMAGHILGAFQPQSPQFWFRMK